jgi:DNA-binding transcriptional LysR family regulator
VPAVVRGGDAAEGWSIAVPGGPSTLPIEPVLRLSSLIMIRDAVRAGAGVARLPLSLVSRDIAAGRLAHWGDVQGSDIAIWALYPSRRLLSARVSAFLDLLRQAFPLGVPDELAAYIDR